MIGRGGFLSKTIAMARVEGVASDADEPVLWFEEGEAYDVSDAINAGVSVETRRPSTTADRVRTAYETDPEGVDGILYPGAINAEVPVCDEQGVNNG